MRLLSENAQRGKRSTSPKAVFLYLSRVFTNGSSHLFLPFFSSPTRVVVSADFPSLITHFKRKVESVHSKLSRSSRIRLRSTLPFSLRTSPSLRKEWWWTLYHSTPIRPNSVQPSTVLNICSIFFGGINLLFSLTKSTNVLIVRSHQNTNWKAFKIN